jgi:hypothetical protein
LSSFTCVTQLINTNLEFRYFHTILHALSGTIGTFYSVFVHQPSYNNDSNDYITSNPKFSPFFDRALRAIDGTHIPTCTPAEDAAHFCNRKGFLSQNVLATGTFDMRFTYVLSGWEGSVADGRLWSDACRHNLEVPKGWYFLGDAGFPLCNELLVPYQGVQYHLHEWEAASLWYI